MKLIQTRNCSKLLLTFLISCVVYVVQAQDIQPYRAEEVKPYQAKEVKPDKAQDVKPYEVKAVKNNRKKTGKNEIREKEVIQARTKEVIPVSEKIKENRPSVNNDMLYFFGLFEYWVPGVSYTTHDYTNQQIVIHNSAGTGVLPGGILINKDNTYIWNSSWDEKIIKGIWRATGDQEYPIELLQAQEGKNWKVGKSNDIGTEIFIWNGSTWYNGKKVHK